jgi:hypothetical protein
VPRWIENAAPKATEAVVVVVVVVVVIVDGDGDGDGGPIAVHG